MLAMTTFAPTATQAAAVQAAAESGASELTGLAGVAADVMEALGPLGVGLLTLVETVFPPIPSEVVLPLAGFLTATGRMPLAAVLVAATVGSVLGACVLYAMGRAWGRDRSVATLSRLPLVDADDFTSSFDWFDRHGRSAVFVGRLIPGVRSLISVPAGAGGMPVAQFLLFTTAGSALWNTALVLLGRALGSQYERVAEYADYLDYVVIAVVVGAVGLLVVRRVRRGRTAT